jgi:ABC-type multidrug transport system ATPase subunit
LRARGVSIMLSTHDPDLKTSLNADQVYFIKNGMMHAA